MSWDDIYDILYDGTKEEISKLRCPDCGGGLSFRFSEYDGGSTFTLRCGCTLSRGHKGPKPNCAEFFGNEYTIA